MKQFTTIICSVMFVIAGALIIGIKDKPTPTIFLGNMETYAQPKLFNPDQLKMPLTPQITLDERTDMAVSHKVDTLYLRDTVTVTKVKPKYVTKQKTVFVPEIVEVHDTVCVPIFFLATPLEYDVKSTELITIDEVQGSGYSEDETDVRGDN